MGMFFFLEKMGEVRLLNVLLFESLNVKGLVLSSSLFLELSKAMFM